MPTARTTAIPLPAATAFSAALNLIELANHGAVTFEFDVGDGSQAEVVHVELSKADKATLHSWLEKLPTPPPRTLKKIAAEVGHLTGPAELDVTVRGNAIHLNLDYRLTAQSNLTVLAYLFAGVLTKGGPLAKSIRKCPECDIYFFDKPSGRPFKQFCRPEHSNAYRQRKYRRGKVQ